MCGERSSNRIAVLTSIDYSTLEKFYRGGRVSAVAIPVVFVGSRQLDGNRPESDLLV